MTNFDIINLTHLTQNFSKSPIAPQNRIKCIIAHSMGVSLQQVFNIIQNKEVSTHYFVPQISAQELIAELPISFQDIEFKYPYQVPVIQFVSDDDVAWHAGASHFGEFNKLPNCSHGLNQCSIGIEFHAPGYNVDGDDFHSHWNKACRYTQEQETIGIALIDYLMNKYTINNQNLFAHSTIAPGRKSDPGPFFFWQKLHDHEIGYLPARSICNDAVKIIAQEESEIADWIQHKLQKIGFNNCSNSKQLDPITKQHITAYIMQYAPHLWNKEQEPDFFLQLISSMINFKLSF